jgi:hypothetical protein
VGWSRDEALRTAMTVATMRLGSDESNGFWTGMGTARRALAKSVVAS